MKRRRRQYILLEQWVLKSYLSSIESNNSFVWLWLLIGAKLTDLARSTHGSHKVTMSINSSHLLDKRPKVILAFQINWKMQPSHLL